MKVRAFFLRGERLHPLWRGVAYLFLLQAAEAVIGLLTGVALLFFYAPSDIFQAFPWRAALCISGPLRLVAYSGLALLLGRFLDREPLETMGLAQARAGKDGVLGLALGLVAMLAVGGVGLALAGGTLSHGSGGVGTLLLDLLAFVPAAAAEEIAFRGYFQRLFASWKGPVVGVVVPSLLFALSHGLNPNVNVIALFNIVLVGVLLALVVERRGTLWLAIGYHVAWNVAQGALLGQPVSGIAWEGLLSLGMGGPALLSGGDFGPEGGLLVTAVLLVSLIPLWRLARPVTVAAASRRQRAVLERHWGRLPHAHHSVDIDGPLFEDLSRAVRSRNREGEVTLLLRRGDGDLLLHTKLTYPPDVYRLPSGGIQRAEAVLDAARRETKEETGLALQQARPVGLLTYRLRQGWQRLFFHTWLVLGEVEGDPAPLDPAEPINGYRWVPLTSLGEIAAALRALPSDWAGWGRFRALTHEAAPRWLGMR